MNESSDLTWEQPNTIDFGIFKRVCQTVYPISSAQLNSAWFHSTVRRYWNYRPNAFSANRLAFSCLMKGFSDAETFAIVGAWYLHHNQTLTNPEIDELARMVTNKRTHGKGAKRIIQAESDRKAKKVSQRRERRAKNREASGQKKRTSAYEVWALLPESVDMTGEDLDDFIFNEGRPRNLKGIQVDLGVSYRAVVCHLSRLKNEGKAFKNGSMWYRDRNAIWVLFNEVSK